MTKKQISLRLSDLTARQLAELADLWGTTQTETITVVVDRVYRDEVKNDESKDNSK